MLAQKLKFMLQLLLIARLISKKKFCSYKADTSLHVGTPIENFVHPRVTYAVHNERTCERRCTPSDQAHSGPACYAEFFRFSTVLQ